MSQSPDASEYGSPLHVDRVPDDGIIILCSTCAQLLGQFPEGRPPGSDDVNLARLLSGTHRAQAGQNHQVGLAQTAEPYGYESITLI